jgi:hypothetical protein
MLGLASRPMGGVVSLFVKTIMADHDQIPSVWGPLQKGEDPYAPVEQKGCCNGESLSFSV